MPATELETERGEDMEVLKAAFPFLKQTGKNLLLLEDAERLPKILHFIADKNVPILRMERQEADLEELFMEVTGR